MGDIGDPPSPPDGGECVQCGARLANPRRCDVCGAAQYTTRSALLVILVALPLIAVSRYALREVGRGVGSPLEGVGLVVLASLGPTLFLLGFYMLRRRAGWSP